LFDEVEEVFTINGHDRSDDEATVPQKSFLNTLLESNKVPTLWIANSVTEFDAAYLRRFDVCIEMPIPPRSKRLCMLQDAFQGSISNALSSQIASHDKVSPALIHQVAKVIDNLTSCTTIAEREQRVVQLVNEQLRAQGAREVQYNSQQACARLNFDPDLVHCVENLKQLIEGLKATKMGRLCLYGPPGTGKTAFGKWVAESLDLPHRVVSGATLRGPYVGDTEKNIARTFALAKSENAVLQLDEVDTFLTDRSKSLQAHEVAHVNEMLVQMENYEGVFIASTNLMDKLDDAALRRFDLALKFDYLTPDSVSKLFQTCAMFIGVQTIDPEAIQRMKRLRCLTPGDFDQALRRSQLTGIRDINTFIEAMERASQLKRATGSTEPIGFLRAA
jgi:SpoVK/Ycf46/Vps4 family AAA+-type ATPase